MGFPKGSIFLTPAQDIPLLLQVLHSQFITHNQLFEYMQLGPYERHRPTFNWRVRRLVNSGFLQRHCVRAATPELIYTITTAGKTTLVHHFPFMDFNRHKAPASHVNLIHSLELNRLQLCLKRQVALVDWQSEMTIRATNELTPDGYVKNYDAIITVRLDGRQVSFALEYERTPKKPKTYARIRSVLEQENRVGRFLYLVPESKLASLLIDCFFKTTAALYVGLAPDLIRSFREMNVVEARSGLTRPVTDIP